eukprot:362939-Chlamydomonas_euryale.AAC.6
MLTTTEMSSTEPASSAWQGAWWVHGGRMADLASERRELLRCGLGEGGKGGWPERLAGRMVGMVSVLSVRCMVLNCC